ncbi:MAG: DUF5009 domain-containing protein [Chitinophagaceae bacterium]|nr:DUF5009 domain-containing protein [Chitinophagaceae bacterium]
MMETPENIITKKDKAVRLHSLDALRGFDMFWVVSGEFIFHGIASVVKQKHSLEQSIVDWQIITNDSLNSIERFFVGVSNQLHHSPWNGFTFYDLIFPLFIFIAGVSMPYSFGQRLEKSGINLAVARKTIYRSLLKRTLLLVVLGMVVNGALQFSGYENTRFASVLGRIALSCFFAAIIYLNAGVRYRVAWFIALLLGYWAMMMWAPVPGFGAGVLTPEGNFAAYVDRVLLPGKLHRTVYDPEGLLSTIPAIGSALLGIFTGQFLRSSSQNLSSSKRTMILLVSGVVLIIAGWGWGLVFPVNKTIWTSSFVLYAGGWSVLLFAMFYFVMDVAGYKKWSMPFVWMGMNAILIYVAAHGLVSFESTSQFLFGGLISRAPGIWHTALLWAGVAAIQFAGLYYLYKKRIFLKV